MHTQVKNIITTIFIALLLTITLTSGVSAATQDANIELKLLNQNPDPVKPGDIVDLRFGISNKGKSSTSEFYVELEDSSSFEIVEADEKIQKIGFLPAYQDDSSMVVLKYKLKVSENLVNGKYKLNLLRYTESDSKIKETFEVEIKGEPNAEIAGISVQNLVPGKKTQVDFSIKNVGKTDLKNLMFSWESTQDLILALGSSNVKFIDHIGPGETKILSYDIVTNANVKPGLYKLDMTLVYDDIEELQKITESGTLKSEKRKEVKSKAGIYIGGETDFQTTFSQRKPNGDFSFSLSNIGNSKADSVTLTLLPNENITLTGTSSTVLGNLEKGDYSVAEVSFVPKDESQDLNLAFEITYTSSMGQRESQINKVTIPKQSLSSIISLPGDISNNKSKFSISPIIFVGLGVIVVGFLIFRRKKKKGRRR